MAEGECITIICTGGGSERGRNCAASAVATHVNVVDVASRQTGSPLGRSLHCIKPASPTPTGGEPPCKIPTQGAHPNRHEQAGYRSGPEHALLVIASRLRGDTR